MNNCTVSVLALDHRIQCSGHVVVVATLETDEQTIIYEQCTVCRSKRSTTVSAVSIRTPEGFETVLLIN